MKLTALEIKQQSFEKVFRGLDPSEVNAFLTLIASEWEHMTARIRELESDIDRLNEKLKHYERVESALHETLQTAKDSAEQKMAGVKKESKNILEKAEMEANSIVREAHMQRQQVRQSILGLLDRREEVINGIRSYLDNARESLRQFSKDESSLFTLPRYDALEGDDGERKSFRLDDEMDSDSDSDDTGRRDSEENPPGIDQMDDILDELD